MWTREAKEKSEIEEKGRLSLPYYGPDSTRRKKISLHGFLLYFISNMMLLLLLNHLIMHQSLLLYKTYFYFVLLHR